MSNVLDKIKAAINLGNTLVMGVPEREQVRRQISKLEELKVDTDRGLYTLQARFDALELSISDHVTRFEEAKSNNMIGRAKTIKAIAEEKAREHKSLEGEIGFHMSGVRLLNEAIAALRTRVLAPNLDGEIDTDQLLVDKQAAIQRTSKALADADELSRLQGPPLTTSGTELPSLITPAESLELSPELAAFTRPKQTGRTPKESGPPMDA